MCAPWKIKANMTYDHKLAHKLTLPWLGAIWLRGYLSVIGGPGRRKEAPSLGERIFTFVGEHLA